MENQNSRLDNQEHQIQKLQTAVAEIRVALSVYRVEEAAFRKVMLDWMKSQDKQPADDSTGSESSGMVLTSSGLKSASINSSGSSSDANSLGDGCFLPTEIKSFKLQGTLNSCPGVGHDDGQQMPVDMDSSVVGPLTSLGSNMASTTLLNRNTGSRDFTVTAILSQQPQSPAHHLPMATFKLGDQRLGWKGGTVPLIFGSTVPLPNSYAVIIVAVFRWAVHRLIDRSHSFQVHGQGRPPETSRETVV